MSAQDLVHIMLRNEWENCQGKECYQPAGYATDGFVHLSERWQVHYPANFLFTGRRDLVLLMFDVSALVDKLRYEPGDGNDSMEFPHYYGLLPLSAVTRVEEYLPNAAGEFEAYSV